MNDDLKQKISSEYGLPTTYMTEMPSAFDEHIGTLCSLLATHPPPADDTCKILVKEVNQVRWLAVSVVYNIGQAQDNDLILSDQYVSDHHCRIEKTEAGWGIEDMGSTNGIFVNREKRGHKTLRDGDIIQVGSVLMLFLGDD